MAEAIITRRGGGALVITGQTEITGTAQESISKFDTVFKLDNDDTFGKLTNPATLPTGLGRGVAFSQNNDYMSVAHPLTPFITIYKNFNEGIYKANNILPPFFDSAGYALQNGNATDTINMMKLFDKE
jgi:hypothetical protein